MDKNAWIKMLRGAFFQRGKLKWMRHPSRRKDWVM